MGAEINSNDNILDDVEALQKAKGQGSKSHNEKTRGAISACMHFSQTNHKEHLLGLPYCHISILLGLSYPTNL